MTYRYWAACAATIAGLSALAGADPALAKPPIINPEVNGTLVLELHAGGEFDYDLAVSGTADYHFIVPADGALEIFGMADVTGAAVGGDLAGSFSASYTATTATFEANSLQSWVVSSTPYGDFEVYSTAPDIGTVSFLIDHSTGTLTATTVNGPAAPEPSTWTMMALGFAAMAAFCGRSLRARVA